MSLLDKISDDGNSMSTIHYYEALVSTSCSLGLFLARQSNMSFSVFSNFSPC